MAGHYDHRRIGSVCFYAREGAAVADYTTGQGSLISVIPAGCRLVQSVDHDVQRVAGQDYQHFGAG